MKSAYFFGIECFSVDVELNFLDRSMPGFEIIGLASKEVGESRERVKNGVLNSFNEFPYGKKIVVNLAPADVPKEGCYYDLAIAAGIISYMRKVSFPEESAFFGEVSMDGGVRKTKGVYLFAAYAKENCIKNIFIPRSCIEEVKDIKDVRIYPINHLSELVDYSSLLYKGDPSVLLHSRNNSTLENLVDFNDVVGQDSAKRALEICASGGHNIFMVGSPGSGKSMLAKALCGILPPLIVKEVSEVAKIYSAAGLFDIDIHTRMKQPFRSPHHTISYSGMVGGGSIPKPGEISLAHKGVLFLDEFSEFQPSIIECLRQPMEDGFITISRIRGSVKLPCDFTLVACSNPCPCGFFGDRKVLCTCKPYQIEKYKKKISGPIMDRIDILARVWSPELDSVSASNTYLSKNRRVSNIIKSKVGETRLRQKERFKNSNITLNARMTNDLIKAYCHLDQDCTGLLDKSIQKFNFTPRSIYKIIKVARTIADMEGTEKISAIHLAESIQYKCL